MGPILGLTPVLNQSGESHRVGRVSLCGDGMMRTLLYDAAQVLLNRVAKWSWLKAWAMSVAKRRGLQKAMVALARRLAVIMHRMWSDGTEFCWFEGQHIHSVVGGWFKPNTPSPACSSAQCESAFRPPPASLRPRAEWKTEATRNSLFEAVLQALAEQFDIFSKRATT